mmetsp:Transcript_12830/g.14671  ORF Transcript_12830/g.14671 Transcript_12830/m.14671 type:complete len:213 (-) Transcript_12830:619-1257(-)
MITCQSNESTHHFSNYIGELMHKYRIFQNLLALRATEIKVINRGGKQLGYNESLATYKKLMKFSSSKGGSFDGNGSDSGNQVETIGDFLQDGDEFIFRLVSFDKWITIKMQFELDGYPDVSFSAKTEMRVAGYYQNIYFFNLIQKLAITIWNKNIESFMKNEEYYAIKEIKFRNKKIVKERIGKENQDGVSLFELDTANIKLHKANIKKGLE